MQWTGLLFYLIGFLIAGGIYAILCLALNVQWGMGGLFNAGIAGFFAVGAYASAILTASDAPSHVGGFGLPVPFGLAAAALVAGVTGYLVAKICIRLKSDYLAMASIGIGRGDGVALMLRNDFAFFEAGMAAFAKERWLEAA